MYVKMHIIFVTLTHRYWGEELKGRLMNTKKKNDFFQLHLSHSFAYITPPPLIITWNIDRQQHFHLFYRSCYLQYVYIYLITLSSSFEWFRVSPPITTFNWTKGKQATILNSYNGERETILLSMLFVLSFIRRLIFLIIATSHPLFPSSFFLVFHWFVIQDINKQEIIIHLCLTNY